MRETTLSRTTATVSNECFQSSCFQSRVPLSVTVTWHNLKLILKLSGIDQWRQNWFIAHYFKSCSIYLISSNHFNQSGSHSPHFTWSLCKIFPRLIYSICSVNRVESLVDNKFWALCEVFLKINWFISRIHPVKWHNYTHFTGEKKWLKKVKWFTKGHIMTEPEFKSVCVWLQIPYS